MDVSPTIQHLHGRIISITGTDPAAQTEISETVPARRRWSIKSIFFHLITDVTVANRHVSLIIDDGTNELWRITCANAHPASCDTTYSFAQIAATEALVDCACFHPLPDLSLPAGARIRTSTPLLKAGDNFSAPQLLVEEWIDP
ncbi:hypothetical protein ES703_16756 [subsurface metagenome]